MYKSNNGNCLRDLDGFCILGVIADFWAKEKEVEWKFNKAERLYEICNIAYILPNEILDWADISDREEKKLIALFDKEKSWGKIREYLLSEI